ncbi:MAG: riboflavin synthase [Rickettsiales bacterium]|nr:riboflavin synthase [Rickettsiales bacterium]
MFSGIIKEIGEIESFSKNKSLLGIRSGLSNLVLGESISCSGVCLTVSEIKNNIFFCNLSKETLKKTNFSMIRVGNKINLEKSLKMGDEISGHLVFGHVDGLSKIKKIINIKNSRIIELIVPKEIMKFLSPKCSISLDGISLTVNKVKKKIIDVSIIPHTWENTSLKFLEEGSLLNTEIDMLARYVFKALKK